MSSLEPADDVMPCGCCSGSCYCDGDEPAIQAREDMKCARRGKPVAFPSWRHPDKSVAYSVGDDGKRAI